jgi:hypothetical protein
LPGGVRRGPVMKSLDGGRDELREF